MIDTFFFFFLHVFSLFFIIIFFFFYFDFTEGGRSWEEGLIGGLHKIGYMPRNFNC